MIELANSVKAHGRVQNVKLVIVLRSISNPAMIVNVMPSTMAFLCGRGENVSFGMSGPNQRRRNQMKITLKRKVVSQLLPNPKEIELQVSSRQLKMVTRIVTNYSEEMAEQLFPMTLKMVSQLLIQEGMVQTPIIQEKIFALQLKMVIRILVSGIILKEEQLFGMSLQMAVREMDRPSLHIHP